MKDIIHYDQLTLFLKQASLFEIYRFSVAIRNELKHPERVALVRKKFKEGDILVYFNEATHTFIPVRVLKKNSKYVLLEHCDDAERYKIPYYLLKRDAREFDFSSPGKRLSRNELKVGGLGGF